MSNYKSKPRNVLESAQELTTSWAKVCAVTVGFCDKIIFRPEVVINNSNRIQFQVLERLESLTGGNTYSIMTENLANEAIYMKKQIVELEVNEDQRPVIVVETMGLNFIELQAKVAGATGSGATGESAATIDSVYVNEVYMR